MQTSLLNAPNARFRLYTNRQSYSSFFSSLLFKGRNSQEKVREFELKLATFLKAQETLCVPMCRVGIYLTLKNLLKPGTKIILSPYTIADVINMVLNAGLIPVFADIQRETCNLDAEEVAKLIDENTSAVLVTHLHGLVGPVAELKTICDKKGILLLEDSAQAFGAMSNGMRAGTIGEAGFYSFGTYKNIGAWYGGAIVSNNKKFLDQTREEVASFRYQDLKFIGKRILSSLLKDVLTVPVFFKSFTFWVFRFGFLHRVNWINKRVMTELDVSRQEKMKATYLAKMHPFQAELAKNQLGNIDADSRERVRKAEMYYEGLKGIDQLILAPLKKDLSHIYTYFPVQYKNRDELIAWMMKLNCDVAAQHLKNCADLEGFKDYYRDCPNARATAAEVILLPTYPRYTDNDVNRNIEVIKSFFAST